MDDIRESEETIFELISNYEEYNIYILEFQIESLKLFDSKLMEKLNLISYPEKLDEFEFGEEMGEFGEGEEKSISSKQFEEFGEEGEEEELESIQPRLTELFEEELFNLKIENIPVNRNRCRLVEKQKLEEEKKLKILQDYLLKKVNTLNNYDLYEEDVEGEFNELDDGKSISCFPKVPNEDLNFMNFYYSDDEEIKEEISVLENRSVRLELEKGQIDVNLIMDSVLDTEQFQIRPNKVKVILEVFNFGQIEIDPDQFGQNFEILVQKFEENPTNSSSSLNCKPVPKTFSTPLNIVRPYLEQLQKEDPFKNDLTSYLENKITDLKDAIVKKQIITIDPLIFLNKIDYNPIFIGLYVDNDPINFPLKLIGMTELYLNDEAFINVILNEITESSVLPDTASKLETLFLINELNQIIGDINVFVKLSSYGRITRPTLPDEFNLTEDELFSLCNRELESELDEGEAMEEQEPFMNFEVEEEEEGMLY